jgi:Transposase DDE domain group 1
MSGPAERVVAFYNKRGTCEQWIKEGKGAIKWTRLSCRTFAANAVRLQLHALAYNLGNFLRTLATPEPIKDSSEGQADQDRREGGEPRPLCRLPDGRGRHRTANVPRDFAAHRGTAAAATTASVRRSMSCIQEQPTERVRPNARENGQINPSTSVRAARAAGSHPHLASVLLRGRKSANIHASSGVIRGIPAFLR